MSTRPFFLLIFATCIGFYSLPASAGLEYYETDGCVRGFENLPAPELGPYSIGYEFSYKTIPEVIPAEWVWRCTIYWMGGVPYSVGYRFLNMYPSNNPTGPALGEAMASNPGRTTPAPVDFEDVTTVACLMVTAACLSPFPDPITKPLCAIGSWPCFGWAFYEAVKRFGGGGGALYRTEPNNPQNEPQNLMQYFSLASEGQFSIPFLVENQGDGDWIVFSVNGVEFFRRLLSDFEIGKVYWVNVPDGIVNSDYPNLWAYWMETSGAEDAIFYVGAETLPLIPGC